MAKRVFANNNKLEHLKMILLFVKKGHATPINDIILVTGGSMTTRFYAYGTKEKYVVDILGGEEKNKEGILALIPESKYNDTRGALVTYFKLYPNAQGVLLTFNISALAGVVAYKFLTDYEGANQYGSKENK